MSDLLSHTRDDLNEIPREAGLVLLARHPAPIGDGKTVGAQPAGRHICNCSPYCCPVCNPRRDLAALLAISTRIAAVVSLEAVRQARRGR